MDKLLSNEDGGGIFDEPPTVTDPVPLPPGPADDDDDFDNFSRKFPKFILVLIEGSSLITFWFGNINDPKHTHTHPLPSHFVWTRSFICHNDVCCGLPNIIAAGNISCLLNHG